MSELKKKDISKIVTFFIGGLSGGGSERVCINLANKLASDEVDVRLVVCNLDDDKYSALIDHNVTLVNLNVRARYSFFRLAQYLIKNNVGTAFALSHEIAVLLVVLRGMLNRKYRIVARNVNNLKMVQGFSESNWSKFVVMNLVKMFYPKVDFVVCQCKKMEQDLTEWIPSLVGKTDYIYNPYVGFNIEVCDISNVALDADYLLCVGRLEKQKGFDYAIKGFAKIKDQYPNLNLYILGQGSMLRDLQDLARDLEVDNKIKFLGFQSDVKIFYKNARATVLTSLYEGFPNVLVESISLGTPIVAFDCPSGPSEIVETGINGFLVNYRDVDDLSKNLCRVLDCPLSDDAIIKTSEKFSWRQIVARYKAILISDSFNC